MFYLNMFKTAISHFLLNFLSFPNELALQTLSLSCRDKRIRYNRRERKREYVNGEIDSEEYTET